MEDSICQEVAIKINLRSDIYFDDNNIGKFIDTNLSLNGIYEDEDGDINYFKNGKWHNENGPAEFDRYGYKAYFINNKRHRIDGPAEICSTGEYAWWINDYYVSQEIMDNWLKENEIPLDWNIWSNEDKMLFALHWSDYEG